MIPVRARLIIPADKMPLSQLSGHQLRCQIWLRQMQRWLKREAGVTYAFDFETHVCPKTHAELSWGEGRDHRDQYGEGIYETNIWDGCFRTEMGLGTEVPGWNVYRWTAFVIGAGGWAGGRNTAHNPNHPKDNTGTSLIGDWQLTANVRRKVSPSCAAFYPNPGPVGSNGPCTANGAAWGHEMLHMLGVHCHDADTLIDGEVLPYTTWPLQDDVAHEPMANHLHNGQRQELYQNSARFLTSV